MHPRSSGLIPLLLLCACVGSNRYGSFHRPISTSENGAQVRFDEGLLLCYGFNHDEAVRCFESALKYDPGSAMAWWGIAYALGPNFNLPLTDPAVATRAHAAAQQAQALGKSGSPVEQALIAAMTARYADPPPPDRSGLDRAYADAMRQVHQQFPHDPDVAVLCAEALLDLSPWNQWHKDGSPQSGTEEILTVLTAVLQEHPQQPMAIHLYIHATEASTQPELALKAAARLPALAPGCGHLVHMPAHTLQRCGQYDRALQANLAGIAVDRAYFASHGPQGIYHLYLAHNQHFACYAAMFLGQSQTALRCARELVADIPAAMQAQQPAFVDGFLAMPLHALLRFGRWEEVLLEPAPAPQFPVAVALWHHARGIALAALGRLPEARIEEQRFAAAVDAVPAGAMVGLTAAADVLGVARWVLTGEVAFRFGEREAAFRALRAGVAAEDALRYDEPSGWMMPVRHALGALLLEVGDVDAAQLVYQEDLQQHPGNGWSLHGLAECQRRGGAAAAAATEAAFAAAWASADVELRGSCFCRRLP